MNETEVCSASRNGGELLIDLRSECQNIYSSFTGFIEGNNATRPYLTDYASSTGYDLGNACKFLLHSIVSERGS